MTAADAAILADVLLERGDKYGEYIHLCLKGDPTAENVRRRHEKKWLGPLAEFLHEIEYEDGLPRAAVLKRTAGDAPEEALDHPFLRTIRRLTTGKTAKTRTGRTNPRTYMAFARAMVDHALCEIDVSDGQLTRLVEHGELFTHLHDLRILDKETQRALGDHRWRNVRWVELRSPAHLFHRVLATLRADQGMFRRNQPDVVMHLTTSGSNEDAQLRAAFAELPVRSFLLYGRLRFHRVDGAVRIEDVSPPPEPPEMNVARINRALAKSADNGDDWRVARIEPPQVVCIRAREEHAVTLALDPADVSFVPALLRALDELDVDGAHRIRREIDRCVAADDTVGLLALASEHASHAKVDWPQIAHARYASRPTATLTRAMLGHLPETWIRHASSMLIIALEHGLLEDARVAASHLGEVDYARWGRLRSRARTARMTGEAALADLFDEIAGRRVSYPM